MAGNFLMQKKKVPPLSCIEEVLVFNTAAAAIKRNEPSLFAGVMGNWVEPRV
ncbi:hypothetical protein [Sediminibacillus halophilus]|uniref:Uncharacterized protein n=1 Tax=Sediminibacillus halophilus TaxID=482461 RepID=A0A1G9NEP5_9BACI|nr:hypothetical protein [Sediminibacillus halophilus]SDL85018.1 hypothetical protein SAMN05216244_0971 [Sediminibacillus halophilus]